MSVSPRVAGAFGVGLRANRSNLIRVMPVEGPRAMPTHAIDILLAHDRWATDQLLDACAALDDGALDRPFEMGRGSLRQTLVHMVDVIGIWRSRLTGDAYEPLPPDANVDRLRETHARSHDRFDQQVHDASAESTWSAERYGKKLTAPRDSFVCHVMTHGMHHRAQALNMLRHLGVTTQPQSSVLQWMLATGAGQLQSNP